MEVDAGTSAKIQVKFRTALEKFRVTEKPFQVPTNLNRRGLSQVINHLLGTGDQPQPFDFLINDKFLRTTLESYMKSHNVSTEETIVIDYVELLDSPQSRSISTHSDWISVIDNRLLELGQSFGSKNGVTSLVPYGSYSGQIVLLDSDEAKKVETDHPFVIGLHSQPVLGLSSFCRSGSHFDLLSCSQDSSIYLWSVDVKNQTSRLIRRLVGHEGAVEAVQFDPSGVLIASGSWDDSIKVWSLNDADETETEYKKSSDTKRIKTKGSSPSLQTNPDGSIITHPRSTLTGHNQCVSSIQWMSRDQFISGSWDHSLRIWDVESGVSTSKFEGHADRSVRTWDPRTYVGETALSTTLTSHEGWVPCVKWHPTQSHVLISGSFDGSIKIWDIRSTTPVHTLPAQHKEKVTTISWLDNDHFVSGGADNNIKVYSFPQPLNN